MAAKDADSFIQAAMKKVSRGPTNEHIPGGVLMMCVEIDGHSRQWPRQEALARTFNSRCLPPLAEVAHPVDGTGIKPR